MKHPFTLGLLAVNAPWTLLIVLAPTLVAPGSLHHLDGSPNFVEHQDQWATLPALVAFTYGLGDLVCHQMASRSLTIAGNQMPIDARMFAIFLTANLGLAAAAAAPTHARARDVLHALLPRMSRFQRPLATLWAVGLAPVAVDGILQLLTPYESTTTMRLATGAWTGIIGAFALGIGLDALSRPLPPVPATPA